MTCALLARRFAAVLPVIAAAALVACTTTPQPASGPMREVADRELEAEAVVDAMTAAWNAHNSQRYAAFLHPDVIVQTLEADAGNPTGREAMAESSAQFFAREPAAKIEIVSRMSDGRFVIERERMVGLSNGSVFWTTVIYEVRDRLVVRMWIVPRTGAAAAR
jgi:hypothetical protein